MNRKQMVGVVVSLLLVGVSHGNGFRNPPETAAGMARDGGKLVHTDDASAVAVNPANLADLERGSAVLGFTTIHTETDYEGLAGSSTTDDPWKLLPNLFAALPVGEQGVVLGLGLTTPYGQSTVWEEDSVFRYTAPYEAELLVVNVNPSLGYRINDRVAVGAGLDVYQSTLSFRQFFPWSGVIPGAPDGRMKFEGDGTGWGWNAGVLINLTERQQVAATYRSGVKVDYDGDFSVSGTPAPVAQAGLGRPSDFESDIDFPSTVVVGYGVKASDRLRVGIDVEWVEFSSYDSLPIDIGSNQALLPVSALAQDWDDIWTFGLGADWTCNANWVVRGGYKFMPSPIPSSTVAPTLPDSDKHQLSAGVGYSSGVHHVDVAVAYSIYEDLSVTGNQNPAYNGDYDISSQIVSISYTLDF